MGQGGSQSRAWGLTWCSAPPCGHPHALLPTPLDLSLAAPSLHPSRPLDPQMPTRPSLICSLTFPGARGGWQGIRPSRGFLCRLPPSRAAELRAADPVLSGVRGGSWGWKVISRGGARRLQREELSHLPKFQNHPDLPSLWIGKQVRNVQSISQGDRLHL